ncbi:MAG: SDR family NAD(P)-dependent oxidoreductase, partial [Chitinophagaceae bacterium]|nr:SDR family NAD(P)-dependent oxidoreductase [Chitinophagaceae bacterium]
NLVAISGRRNDLLLQLQNQYPEAIIPFCFDVTGSGNIAHLQSMIKRLGGLDLLIYNAGFSDPSKELNCETEIITTKTNVSGFVEIVSWTFNYFAQQGYGQIAVTSSVAALGGSGWAPAYSASKAFMSNYAEGLNIKAHRMKKDIIVTDIKPGFIDTKPPRGHKRFWVAPAEKAARQIVHAIAKGKRTVYITRRWWLIAQLLKILPYFIYRNFA